MRSSGLCHPISLCKWVSFKDLPGPFRLILATIASAPGGAIPWRRCGRWHIMTQEPQAIAGGCNAKTWRKDKNIIVPTIPDIWLYKLWTKLLELTKLLGKSFRENYPSGWMQIHPLSGDIASSRLKNRTPTPTVAKLLGHIFQRSCFSTASCPQRLIEGITSWSTCQLQQLNLPASLVATLNLHCELYLGKKENEKGVAILITLDSLEICLWLSTLCASQFLELRFSTWLVWIPLTFSLFHCWDAFLPWAETLRGLVKCFNDIASIDGLLLGSWLQQICTQTSWPRSMGFMILWVRKLQTWKKKCWAHLSQGREVSARLISSCSLCLDLLDIWPSSSSRFCKYLPAKLACYVSNNMDWWTKTRSGSDQKPCHLQLHRSASPASPSAPAPAAFLFVGLHLQLVELQSFAHPFAPRRCVSADSVPQSWWSHRLSSKWWEKGFSAWGRPQKESQKQKGCWRSFTRPKRSGNFVEMLAHSHTCLAIREHHSYLQFPCHAPRISLDQVWPRPEAPNQVCI